MQKYFFSIVMALLVLLTGVSCNNTNLIESSSNRGPGGTTTIYKDINPPHKPIQNSSVTGQMILSSYSGSYALLIGESDYSNGWPNLNSIPQELEKVETVLKAQGFKVEKSLNLNASELKARFERFVNDYGYKPNNRLLFFYSGHGYTDSGQGFLVPTDAPNPETNLEDFLKKSLVMTDITALARKMRAKHVLFLFDSCFSGSVFKAKERPKVPRQISKLANEPVRQFITAGSENQTVPANSTFTPAFVDALEYGLGDLTEDGYITGQELGLYLQNEVPKYTSQTPQYGKISDYNLSRGDFVFIVGANAVPQHQNSQQVAQVSNNISTAEQLAEIERLKREKAEAEAKAREAEAKAREAEAKARKAKAERERLARIAAEQKLKQTTAVAQVPVVSLPTVLPKPEPQSGKVFRDTLRDGSQGPEMVWIPAGSFRMGDIQGGGYSDEKPVHRVSIDRFAMGKYEVTVGEYLRFVKATGKHAPEWMEKGSSYNIKTGSNNYYKELGSALTNKNHPIVGVSWLDAVAYAKWLSQQTGKKYRLPTEAEWEYAARAGTETKYWWGNNIGSNKANCWNSDCKDSFKYTAPVGSFSANPFGLYDTVGNVWEWTCSEYKGKYQGSEQTCKNSASIFVLRGGSWNIYARRTRTASRNLDVPTVRDRFYGFRLIRTP